MLRLHTFGGWFDIFSAGTLNGYAGMSRRGKTPAAREKSHMVIGHALMELIEDGLLARGVVRRC